jgi:hypothetical protein
MALGIVLVVVGAIMRYAVTATATVSASTRQASSSCWSGSVCSS